MSFAKSTLLGRTGKHTLGGRAIGSLFDGGTSAIAKARALFDPVTTSPTRSAAPHTVPFASSRKRTFLCRSHLRTRPGFQNVSRCEVNRNTPFVVTPRSTPSKTLCKTLCKHRFLISSPGLCLSIARKLRRRAHRVLRASKCVTSVVWYPMMHLRAKTPSYTAVPDAQRDSRSMSWTSPPQIAKSSEGRSLLGVPEVGVPMGG